MPDELDRRQRSETKKAMPVQIERRYATRKRRW
jgi:hypothetical protein